MVADDSHIQRIEALAPPYPLDSGVGGFVVIIGGGELLE